MNDIELKYVDPDDINDLIPKIEKSFNIQFEANELQHISTVGELFDRVLGKMTLAKSTDCTSQQAFYKMREAFASLFNINKENFTTDTLVASILPPKNRRSNVKKLETYLGIKLNILNPPQWLSTSIIILFLLSIVMLFFNWKIAELGIIVSICATRVANKMGNEIQLKTVGELVNKMTSENYLKSRRDSTTYNKQEIERTLIDLFSSELLLDKSKLTRDARFV
jgi:hypothetical protein